MIVPANLPDYVDDIVNEQLHNLWLFAVENIQIPLDYYIETDF